MGQEETDLTFESALEELEIIVTRLESAELSLEEAMTLYERGQQLVRLCNNHLEAASLKVEALTEDGEIVEQDV